MKIQNFTTEKRKASSKILYGALLMIISVTISVLDPLNMFTDWYIDMREGSYVYKVWENVPYELFTEVWVYNYTNIPQYEDGTDKVLKLQEVGPFTYQEFRTNQNITVDKESGIMSMKPNISLEFRRHMSIADTKDVNVSMPNLALIAISTLAADKLSYFGNAGAFYSIKALGSKLFRNLTVDEVLWGYEDPIVTVASTLLPGWIDFGKIGILDRFYAHKADKVEVDIKNKEKKYSILTWDGEAGLPEQGYTTFNTSTLCNRLEGAYEGLMVPTKLSKDTILPIFRKQACRVYPFTFDKELLDENGFTKYRFTMEKTAFSRSSPYACSCNSRCLPDGFVDVSSCYYGFPIALSKPHFLDADPVQQSYYEGMHPDPAKHNSRLDVSPNIGAPLALASTIQVNVAVRTSPANPITEPLKDKVVPLLWVSLYCKTPPPQIVSLLRLRFVIAPPLIIAIEAFLFITGFYLGVYGFYRICRPKYRLVNQIEDLVIDSDIKKDVFFPKIDTLSSDEIKTILSVDNEDSAKDCEKRLVIGYT